MDFKSKIILIYGPTASGKSEFAVKLAKKIKGEIINADSMQVYKELKILSARPSKKDYKNIKHHLYGFQALKKNYSSGEWLKAAKKKISEIKKRKNVPIIVGGTGLYFKTLTDGIVNIPRIPIQIREKVRKLNSSMGNKNFLKKLKKTWSKNSGLRQSAPVPLPEGYRTWYITAMGVSFFHKERMKTVWSSKNLSVHEEFNLV